MLSSIRIQRFKKFQDVEAHPRPFTVLMGENSSGKTTVLQAISLALSSLFIHKLVETDSSSNVSIRQKGVGLTTLPGMSISDLREVYYAKKIGGEKQKDLGVQILISLMIRIIIIDFKLDLYMEPLT